MVINLEGYHGTSESSAKSIMGSNYSLSYGDREWLGDGAYFFTRGINNNPDIQAKDWAIAQAWNNQLRKNTYNRYCVIRSEIKVDENSFLDLTISDGIEILEYLIKKFEDHFKKVNKKLKYLDGAVINFAREQKILPIDVVKGSFYVKFSKQRILGLTRRTPNCTMCAVYSTQDCITSKTIIMTGDI